jgi:hypothetical protein
MSMPTSGKLGRTTRGRYALRTRTNLTEREHTNAPQGGGVCVRTLLYGEHLQNMAEHKDVRDVRDVRSSTTKNTMFAPMFALSTVANHLGSHPRASTRPRQCSLGQ